MVCSAKLRTEHPIIQFRTVGTLPKFSKFHQLGRKTIDEK